MIVFPCFSARGIGLLLGIASYGHFVGQTWLKLCFLDRLDRFGRCGGGYCCVWLCDGAVVVVLVVVIVVYYWLLPRTGKQVVDHPISGLLEAKQHKTTKMQQEEQLWNRYIKVNGRPPSFDIKDIKTPALFTTKQTELRKLSSTMSTSPPQAVPFEAQRGQESGASPLGPWEIGTTESARCIATCLVSRWLTQHVPNGRMWQMFWSVT